MPMTLHCTPRIACCTLQHLKEDCRVGAGVNASEDGNTDLRAGGTYLSSNLLLFLLLRVVVADQGSSPLEHGNAVVHL